MKLHLVLASLSCFLVACAPSPDYLGTVLAFQKHKNGGDLESALQLFADEPSFHFGPLGTITGLTEFRGILEYDLALNTHLQFEDCMLKGIEVSCRVIESNDWLRTVDIDSIIYDENRFTFTQDGHIKSVSATLSAESSQFLGAAMAEFHEWAVTHKPVEYGELFTKEGNFVYSRENAGKVLTLLRLSRDK